MPSEEAAQPRSAANEAFETRYEERKDYYDHTHRKLDGLYSANQGEKIESRTFAEYTYRKYMFGRIESNTPENGDPDWSFVHTGLALSMISTTRALQHAVEILQEEYGVDIIGNRKQFAEDPTLFQKVRGALSEHVHYEDGGRQVIDEDGIAYTYAQDIVNIFGGTKAFFTQGIANTNVAMAGMLSRQAALMSGQSQLRFYDTIVKNISSARYDAHETLKYIMSDEVNDYLALSEDWYSEITGKKAANPELVESILDSQKQELDYTILPPGTEIEAVARDIVEESSEGSKATVDLQRLAVLEEVRQLFGPEHCFLMRGKKTGKEMAGEDGSLISEDYIGLIMQHHDADGTVTREDCLAISPIAKKHAGYIVRQDASEGISWREILSLPKNDAIRYFNARRLRFDPVAGEDKYEAYVKKAVALITCDTEKFNSNHRLRRTKAGDYEMIFRPQNIGSEGLRSASLFA